MFIIENKTLCFCIKFLQFVALCKKERRKERKKEGKKERKMERKKEGKKERKMDDNSRPYRI